MPTTHAACAGVEYVARRSHEGKPVGRCVLGRVGNRSTPLEVGLSAGCCGGTFIAHSGGGSHNTVVQVRLLPVQTHAARRTFSHSVCIKTCGITHAYSVATLRSSHTERRMIVDQHVALDVLAEDAQSLDYTAVTQTPFPFSNGKCSLVGPQLSLCTCILLLEQSANA
eukprot:m.936726 g.936726  ORF g.936726 m.936726 type:complete len:168 (-) comp23811_c0_seq4:2604-3107(-)